MEYLAEGLRTGTKGNTSTTLLIKTKCLHRAAKFLVVGHLALNVFDCGKQLN
jgi:hypothetical protein